MAASISLPLPETEGKRSETSAGGVTKRRKKQEARHYLRARVIMGIHLCPCPASHGAPSATLPGSSLLSNSRSSPFFRPLPSLKMQTGTARRRLVSRCAADRTCNSSSEEDPIAAQYRRYREKMDKFEREYGAALRAVEGCSSEHATVAELETTLFRREEDKIQTYVREIASDHCILYKKGRGLALMFCARVGMAIHLSSMVTANAHLRIGASSGISFHTVEQIIRMYVSTFVKIVDEICHRKVDRRSIISFLDALRGLAAISHILIQDALAAVNNIEDSSLSYSPECDVEALNHELECNMKELEMKFTTASEREAYELLWPTLTNATRQVSLFVIRMTDLRKKALAHVKAHTRDKQQ